MGMTELRHRRIAEHVCVVCSKPLGESPYKSCDDCRAKNRANMKQRYQRVIREHCCVNCGRQMPKDWYYVHCEKCRAKRKQGGKLKDEGSV